jgi:hypothetical protein
MNYGGVPYQISNPEGSTSNWKGTPGVYSTDFTTNVEGKVEYFDVYGEVRTQYSQVYWTRNNPINLPPALVERFKGKVMAITGYEVDQVTHTAPVENSTTTGPESLGGFSCWPACSKSDKSVPIYNAYNHHYFGWLLGKDAELYEREVPTAMPNPTYTGYRNAEGTEHDYPTNIVFKENPGGEFRKSYHGYPSGYAQLLHSPTQWSVEPMQIDTHNREFSINDRVGYKEAFLPKQDMTNVTNRKSGLSPLIECPCTDRFTREESIEDVVVSSGTCGTSGIATLADCTAAIANAVTVSKSVAANNVSLPSGCIMRPDKVAGSKATTFTAIFNSATSSESCGPPPSGAFVWGAPQKDTGINCKASGCLPSNKKYGCTGEFMGQCTWDSAAAAQAGCGADDACGGFMCSENFDNGRFLCFGRQAGSPTAPMKGATAYTKKFTSHDALFGESASLVNLTLSHDGTTATLTLSGPAGSWFGMGFDAKQMADAPYALIVDGSGAVTERKLVEHGPGTLLPATVKVVSTSSVAGVRTVTVTRSVAHAVYPIPTVPGQINTIVAVGNSPQLAYHKARTGSSITLVPSSADSCMCKPNVQSFLNYMNVSKSAFGGYACLDEPRSDMLKHGDGTGRDLMNAACKMETYNGGLQCCKHHEYLTDLEQASLIPNKTDTYFLKWRYYFQEYTPAVTMAPTAPTEVVTPASHQHLHHWVFLIDASVNDYEEDNAHYGEAAIGSIHANLTAGTMGLEDVPKKFGKIIPHVMTPHCHAPSCIREELWNADTNEIICNITAKYGDEAYGSVSTTPFNEADYVAIPPCIFGNQTGLQTPFHIDPATNIRAVKYFNNTYRHLGQMAQWTGLMVYDTDPYVNAKM